MLDERAEARDVFGANGSGDEPRRRRCPSRTNASIRSRVPRLRRMREHGETAGVVDQPRSRRARASRSFGDVRRAAVAEVAVERVAEVDGPAFGDHRARDVRTPDRSARRLLEHRRRTRCARRARSAIARFARRASRRISRSADELRFELGACRRGAARGCASRRRPRRRSARRRERRERRAAPAASASASPSSVS